MSITLIITLLTVFVSWQAFQNRSLFNKLLHHPFTESREGQYYRWISSGFIHNDWLHLGINMLVFYQFGGIVESIYRTHFGDLVGTIYFLILYLGSIVMGDLPSYYKHRNDSWYSAVGASGGVAGILFAYILFSPFSTMLIYGIIPIYSVIAGILYIGYEQWASRRAKDNIGHDAHIWGAIFGLVFTAIIVPRVLPFFWEQVIEKIGG